MSHHGCDDEGERGRDAGIREAIAVVLAEPIPERTRLRDRVWAALFPVEAARTAIVLWRTKTVARLRRLLDEETA